MARSSQIRRFRRRALSIDDLLDLKSMTPRSGSS
jgi:hypothetical protein